MSRCTRTRSPSPTAMPADSCPRCWSANSPKYVRLATSTCLLWIPKMPHIRYCLLPANWSSLPLAGRVGRGFISDGLTCEKRVFPGLSELRQPDLELALELYAVPVHQPQQHQLHAVPAGQHLQLRHRPRTGAEDVAGLALAEEGRLQGQLAFRPQPGAADAHAGQQTAFCERHQHSAFGHVVSGTQEARGGRVEHALAGGRPP